MTKIQTYKNIANQIIGKNMVRLSLIFALTAVTSLSLLTDGNVSYAAKSTKSQKVEQSPEAIKSAEAKEILANREKLSIAVLSGDIVSYKIANMLCMFAWKSKYGIRECTIVTADNQIDGMKLLLTDNVDFTFVSSNLYERIKESEKWNRNYKNTPKLRSIFGAYIQDITIVESAKSKNKKDKKFGILLNDEGSQRVLQDFLSMNQLDGKKPQIIQFSSEKEMKHAFCNGDIDDVLLKVVHPSLVVNELVHTCDGRIVPLNQNVVAEFEARQYIQSSIDVNEYFIGTNIKPIDTAASTMEIVTTSSKKHDYLSSFAIAMIDKEENASAKRLRKTNAGAKSIVGAIRNIFDIDSMN